MIELNEQNFKENINNKSIVLVDFYATWCGPCGMQSKELEKLKTSRNLNFDIVKVNVDESPRLAMEYGIDSIPTLILFKDNKLIKRTIGFTESEEILKMIEETVANH